MKRVLRYLILPREVSSFEATYLRRMNRVALVFFWLNLPVFALVAHLDGSSVPVAIGLVIGALIGPTIACFGLRSRPRLTSGVFGVTAMVMGGILVYVGQGPMQIEMHFYFFVLIALLAVFANPLVIVVAAATVATHHLVMWFALPAGVFNYEASFWTVVVHGLFVVLESAAACFVARSFFDNVLRLERLVKRRTVELDARSRDMGRILDNVSQGFVTVALDGSLGAERSRALTDWFGVPAPGARVWSYLAGHAPDLEAWIELSFDSLAQQHMPLDVVLAQLPAKLSRGGRELRVEYRPIGVPTPSLLLVVITDVTDEIARLRAEEGQRELITVVEKAYRDRSGFVAFVRDADAMVHAIVTAEPSTLEASKRRVHTLKGNAGLFGVTSVASVCHELESRMDEEYAEPDAAGRALLASAWQTFHARIDRLLGVSQRRTILVDWDEYQRVLASIAQPEPSWATPIRQWGQESTRPYLERFGEQAQQLAQRFGKAELDVTIVDNDVRVDGERFAPVWSALAHAVRNAIDHGIEPTAARVRGGKPERAHLTLTTARVGSELQITVADDGAGIAWDRVAARAGELGHAVASAEDLESALFATGVSTAASVTLISGRGIGMGALREACVDLGGRVEVDSTPGAGTVVRCCVPWTSSIAVGRRRTRSVAPPTLAWSPDA